MSDPTGSATVRNHVIISGTGRAGTTFLVQLLTRLGLDTGFDEDNIDVLAPAYAGLERVFWADDAPYIVKTPLFCDISPELFRSGAVRIERAIIPVRRFEAAAASRVHVQKAATGLADGESVPGGLWGSKIAADQPALLRLKFTRLIEMLVDLDVPITFLMFPRLVQDPDYLYDKLRFLLADIEISAFREAFRAIVRPEWVHQFAGEE